MLLARLGTQAKLALALQGGCLVVESAGGVHEAVCLAQGVCVDVFDVPAVGGVFVCGADFQSPGWCVQASGYLSFSCVTSTRDENWPLSGQFGRKHHLMVQV